jgi:hypothetical protein
MEVVESKIQFSSQDKPVGVLPNQSGALDIVRLLAVNSIRCHTFREEVRLDIGEPQGARTKRGLLQMG